MKKNSGGARSGAGRPRKDTEQICLRVERKTMKLLGGVRKTREYLLDKLKVFEK